MERVPKHKHLVALLEDIGTMKPLTPEQRQQALEAFRKNNGLSPDMSERQIRQSYDYGGDEMMDSWMYCWQLATQAAYEHAANECEVWAVTSTSVGPHSERTQAFAYTNAAFAFRSMSKGEPT